MIYVCSLPDPLLTIVRLEGYVSREAVVTFLELCLQPAQVGLGGDTLVDLRGLENTHGYEDVSRFGDMLSRQQRDWKSYRIALLVDRDVIFGVGRMFDLILSARTEAKVGTFRTLNDAGVWLERPLEALLAELTAEDWVAYSPV